MERWCVDFYDLVGGESPVIGVEGFGDLHERAAANGARHGTPVLVCSSGRVDPRVNLFFRTGEIAGRAASTWRRYAYALAVWLEFLAVFGKEWHEATAGDMEAFKHWRLTDPANGDRVAPSSFDTDRAALNSFYRWASGRYGVANPVPSVSGGVQRQLRRSGWSEGSGEAGIRSARRVRDAAR
ncbi:site-specific integrase [Thermomonospora umbrina]|uniref:site-specific integrase n=1 Tax=Thermomonospora umbrina TaxID=111806 RepID=UPI001FECB516|nr:site-specific integrase [Thermomonospora umbrina]